MEIWFDVLSTEFTVDILYIAVHTVQYVCNMWQVHACYILVVSILYTFKTTILFVGLFDKHVIKYMYIHCK